MLELFIGIAFAGITISPPPSQSIASIITVTKIDGTPSASTSVKIQYRPSWHDTSESAVGITDSKGRIRWTPTVFGPTLLIAGQLTEPTYVKSDSDNVASTIAFWSLVGLSTLLIIPTRKIN